jgi:hypothetical protein
MSKHRYTGGIISATAPAPTQSSASGVWTLDEAEYYQKAGNWPSGSGADPYFQYNTLLLHGDGTNGAQNNTFLDSSTNNFTITRNGNTTQGSFDPYVGPGNWSNYYAATSSAWQTAANTITGILGSTFSSTATFTVEAWIYPVARHSGGGAVLGYVFGSLNPAGANADWSFGPDSNGNLVVFWYQGGNQICKGSSVIPLNTWTHVALSVSSGAIKMFVNGVLESTTGPTSITLSAPALTYVSSGGYVYGGTTWQGFNGYISNLRVIGKRAAYTTTFTPSTTPLVATSDTTLLVNNKAGITDSSAGNYTLTTTGSIAVSKFSPFTFYQVAPASYSGYFDGSGDYLSVPAGAAFNFGTGDFCIEMWVYPIAQSLYGALLAFDAGDYPLTISWASAVGTDIQFNAGSSTAWFISGASFGTTVKNQWTHLVVTRSGNAFRTFQDGVLRSYNSNAGSIGDSSGNIYLASNGTSGYASQASLSNVRIIKGSVPTSYQTSSTTLGTTIFTSPTSPLTTTSQGATAANVSLLTCQSTTFIDNSTNAFTVTANGNATPKVANPFTDTVSASPVPYSTTTYGGSGYFDGTGDYLNLGGQSNLAFGSGDFTVEMWLYFTSTATQQIFDARPTGTASTANCCVLTYISGAINYYTGGTTAISGPTVPTNCWIHLAVCRSGTSTKMFINGAQAGTTYTDTQTYTVGASRPVIGTDGNSPGNSILNGYLSNLRVIKGTAAYTGPFVPPAAPVTAVTNTQLLLNMTNGGIFDNTAINDLETVGAAQISTSVVKYGTGSMSFSGGTSYLVTPTIAPTVFLAPNAWTIEGWFYFNSLTGTSGLMGYPDLLEVTATSTTLVASYRNTPASAKWSTITATVSLGTGAWKHIALVLNNGTMTLYVDGVSVGTPATAVGTPSWGGTGTQRFILGADDQYPFSGTPDVFLNGYIDDFRITNGYARYTTNFTPPALAFPNF